MRAQKNQAELIFFILRLNRRKPSEMYRSLIPSYNIKECFLLYSSRILTYMDLYMCVFMRDCQYTWTAQLADVKVIAREYL